MTTKQQIDQYFRLVATTLSRLDRPGIDGFVEMLLQTCDDGGTIFIFGNGGSAATASHICGDFVKGVSYGCPRKLKTICLNDNVPGLMAIANDISYADIFVEQIRNFLEKKDLVVGISGSGNSPNVVSALEYARQVGARTVAFCGFSGGRIKQIADLAIHAEVDNMEVAEDVHLIVAHCVKTILLSRLKPSIKDQPAQSRPADLLAAACR
jgi:D-sedoheptulose 7-phosphate isomerase